MWLVGNLLWLQSDGLLRDGDEEGHVGAAELLRDLLQSDGLMAWLSASFAGDYGEYPPLYPGLIAAWWTAMGGGVPGATAVRAINLAWPLVAAAAMASMVPRARRALVVALVVLIPGLCGLSRHFMPEGAVVAAVSVVAALSWHAFCTPSWRRAVALGVGVAVAMLIKQTAMLYVLGPLLVALWGLRHRAVVTALTAGSIAGPWYITQWSAQRDYAARSMDVATFTVEGLLYYPVVGLWAELGPILAAVAIVGLVGAWRQPVVRFAAIWAGVGLLVLVSVPRKYPRLLDPLLPACALVAACGVRRERWGWGAAGGAALWTAAASSVWQLPDPPLVTTVDDGCLQRWLRPAVVDDFGLAAIADAVRQRHPQRIVVLHAPPIPCAVQTTHPWIDHLSPYLRRAGVDTQITEQGDGDLIIDWHATDPDVVVDALGGGFSLSP